MSNDPAEPLPLDPDNLIEASLPHARGGMLRYVVGIFVLMVLFSTVASTRSREGAHAVSVLSALGMLGLITALTALTWYAAHSVKAEQQQVESIEELVQLRRWREAGEMLQRLLSRPTRTPQAHVQGLVFLASVLARYHRFGDAVKVYDHLLELDILDPRTAHALRLGRAMSLLREDRLVDADRAIGELRRGPDGAESGGLALIEIYRDVKTGHPDEAIDIFADRLPQMRRQLGHRVADAYVLLAAAYDRLGRTDEAARAYLDATTLSDEDELHRRYPELAPLRGKYRAAPRPEGARRSAEEVAA